MMERVNEKLSTQDNTILFPISIPNSRISCAVDILFEYLSANVYLNHVRKWFLDFLEMME